MVKVFLTGGAGYIGSHLCDLLIRKHFSIRIFDNLSTSNMFGLRSVGLLAGVEPDLVVGDVTDAHALRKAILEFRPDIVVHLAGLKSVHESFLKPELYHSVNAGGTENILEAMSEAKCDHLVFSSSATVYGPTGDEPVTESHICRPMSPYGESKLRAENLIQEWIKFNQQRSAVCLRYFNPIGAHASGAIGENLKFGSPNLMNMISRVAVGELECLPIFGADYLTRDGTAERDYIHISDLVEGHEAAINKCFKSRGAYVFNIGTGNSVSVIRLLNEFQAVSQLDIKYVIEGRRQGDAMISCASVELAQKELNWRSKRDLTEMCVSQWRWLNDGYQMAKEG
jgi:UDP-glucose 4-epimerase